jgi:hypothetical protein
LPLSNSPALSDTPSGFKWRLSQTGSWTPDQKIKARFIEPMLLLRTKKLPEERTGYMNLNSMATEPWLSKVAAEFISVPATITTSPSDIPAS